jgi:hypothetical protein
MVLYPGSNYFERRTGFERMGLEQNQKGCTKLLSYSLFLIS